MLLSEDFEKALQATLNVAKDEGFDAAQVATCLAAVGSDLVHANYGPDAVKTWIHNVALSVEATASTKN